ncbi:MAG: ABC transporter permease [Patescibacteria group bacterium]
MDGRLISLPSGNQINMRQILTVWKKELKDTIRDRRTLMVSIVMPIVFMPLMMVGSIKMQEAQIKSAENQVSIVAVENQDKAPTLINFLQTQDKVEIVTGDGDLKEKLNAGEIQVIVTPPVDFEQKISDGQTAEIVLMEKSTETKSSTAFSKVSGLLGIFNQTLAAQKLAAAKLDPAVLQSIIVKPQDLASEKEKGGFFLGLLLPMFIVLFTFIGGMYIAIDISAGEKERKTLEALLLTPLSRMKIVTGKFMAVATASITSVVLSITSMYAAFKIWPPDFGESVGSFEFSISLSTVFLMLGIGIILSIMFAGLLLAVAIFAKSYKEAQNYVMPFYIATVLPVALLGSYPGFKPTSVFYFIPVVNAVLLFKENLMGIYNSLHIIATLGSLLIFAVLSVIIAAKIYSKESILFRD